MAFPRPDAASKQFFDSLVPDDPRSGPTSRSSRFAEPVLVGIRFHHLDRDLWAAYYETLVVTR